MSRLPVENFSELEALLIV